VDRGASGTIQGGACDGMSLKAKLEAVIYAAEEPVTLAQLAALFADEALEWKAEQDAAVAAAAAAAMAPPTTDPTASPLLSEAFTYLELEQDAEKKPEGEASGEAGESVEQEAGVTTEQSGVVAAGESAGSADEAAGKENETGATDDASASDPAAAAKQEKKQREREARTVIRQMLGELIDEYAADARGIEIREIAGGYRMATKPEFHDAVRSFVKSLKPPLKLSLPAL
jgi:segregation and condensation protein B